MTLTSIELRSAAEAASCGVVIGLELLKVEEIQPMVNERLTATVLMRRGRGLDGVTDPCCRSMHGLAWFGWPCQGMPGRLRQAQELA